MPRPHPPGPRGYSYGVSLGDAAYLGFGIVDGKARGDWWRYNAASHTFTQLATFPGELRWHPAMVAIDRGSSGGPERVVYVGCGSSLKGNLRDWWEYQVASDRWIKRADLPGPSRHHPFYWSSIR